MAIPGELVISHHSVSVAGRHLLTTDGHDFFPSGSEPSLRHSQAVDTPDSAGVQNGALHLRGNVRWTATITRVREFFEFTYPVTDLAVSEDPIPTPEAYAQLWLVHHLRALADITSGMAGLNWNGNTWAKASVDPEGQTDGGFAILTYQIQMAEA